MHLDDKEVEILSLLDSPCLSGRVPFAIVDFDLYFRPFSHLVGAPGPSFTFFFLLVSGAGVTSLLLFCGVGNY